MTLEEKVVNGIATPSEIKEFRNSVEADKMGFDDEKIEGDFSEFEDK